MDPPLHTSKIPATRGASALQSTHTATSSPSGNRTVSSTVLTTSTLGPPPTGLSSQRGSTLSGSLTTPSTMVPGLTKASPFTSMSSSTSVPLIVVVLRTLFG
jgi:hypothetical protein